MVSKKFQIFFIFTDKSEDFIVNCGATLQEVDGTTRLIFESPEERKQFRDNFVEKQKLTDWPHFPSDCRWRFAEEIVIRKEDKKEIHYAKFSCFPLGDKGKILGFFSVNTAMTVDRGK